MSELELLKNINDIDDDLIFEAERWKRPKVHKLKIAVIAAAAAVLCAATAVTATANIKPPKEVIVDGEPLDVDYTVYTDENGREIRTYAYTMPDYAVGEEIEGCTPVGQVRVVKNDEDLWGDWKIVDEAGNVFHLGINNKEVQCDIIDPKNPRATYDIGFACPNFLWKEYTISYIYEDLDDDRRTDKISVYVYRYDDKETARKIFEKQGREFDEKRFDESVERHREMYSISE